MKKLSLLIALALTLTSLIQAQVIKRKLVNGKYGFFDSQGIEIIAPQYEDAREFSEGLAAVKKWNRWGYVNAKNEIIVYFDLVTALDFKEGIAAVKYWGPWGLKWGIIDKKGGVYKPRVDFIYDEYIKLPYDSIFNGEIILKKNNENFYFSSRGFQMYTNEERWQLQTKLREREITLAGVKKDTLLGNMVIEKRIDGSGTILKIGEEILNIKFSNHKQLYYSWVYSFEFDGRKNIYFKSDNKAIKCAYSLPIYEKDPLIEIPNIPWPGEKSPVPEILTQVNGKLTIVNIVNNKTITLPFELNSYGSIIYNNEAYGMCKFNSHIDISFCIQTIYCQTCNGKGSVKGKEYYDYITTTTYKTETEFRRRHTSGYDIIEKKVPVSKTEKVLKPGKSEICSACNGKRILQKGKYMRWNGVKMEG